MIRVRFAPSPTGEMHIGNARTALFNWLFARHHGGAFLLRIEDTDRERSTQENTNIIFDALQWLQLNWDEEPVIQSQRVERHKEVAYELLKNNLAYHCYCEASDETCQCINKPQNEEDIGRVAIRFKVPRDQEKIVVQDLIKGTIEVEPKTLEDFIILRKDQTPTYMLCVVVDDYDMRISHIIRGADHVTNTFKQSMLYQALGWTPPHFGHIPLIHGDDGAKLSKRHGALSLQGYRAMGILPEAMCNYLLRLGWSHGDDEIISMQEAIMWFNLESIGRSASRFDMNKLLFLNAHYLKLRDNQNLVDAIYDGDDPIIKERLLKGMNGLKQRAKSLVELEAGAQFYIKAPTEYEQSFNEDLVKDYANVLESVSDFTEAALLEFSRKFAEERGIKLVEIAQPLRIVLTGSTISPSVFEIMEVLGKEEVKRRL